MREGRGRRIVAFPQPPARDSGSGLVASRMGRDEKRMGTEVSARASPREADEAARASHGARGRDRHGGLADWGPAEAIRGPQYLFQHTHPTVPCTTFASSSSPALSAAGEPGATHDGDVTVRECDAPRVAQGPAGPASAPAGWPSRWVPRAALRKRVSDGAGSC